MLDEFMRRQLVWSYRVNSPPQPLRYNYSSPHLRYLDRHRLFPEDLKESKMNWIKALETPIVIDWGTPKLFRKPDYIEYGHPCWPSWNQMMVPGGDQDDDVR